MDSRVIAGVLPTFDVPPDDESLPDVFSPRSLNFYSNMIELSVIREITSKFPPINEVKLATTATGKVIKKTVKRNEVAAVTDPIGFYVNEVDPNRLSVTRSSGRGSYKVPELAAILESLGVVYKKSGTKKEGLVRLIVDWSIEHAHDIEMRQKAERAK